MTDIFDIEQFIDHYITNIRAMQQLTDAQIRDVMMRKIEDNPDYFEIISDVSRKIDDKKLIRQVLSDHQKTLKANNPMFSGRKIA